MHIVKDITVCNFSVVARMLFIIVYQADRVYVEPACIRVFPIQLSPRPSRWGRGFLHIVKAGWCNPWLEG
jgi:hypothetical protein